MKNIALILFVFGPAGIFTPVPLVAAETLENFLDSNFVSNGTCKVSGCSSLPPWNKNNPTCVKLKFSTHQLKAKAKTLKTPSFFKAHSLCDVKSAACYGVQVIEVQMKHCLAPRSGSQSKVHDFATGQLQIKGKAKHGLRLHDSIQSTDSINRQPAENPPTDVTRPPDFVASTENPEKVSEYTQNSDDTAHNDNEHKEQLHIKSVWRGCKSQSQVTKTVENETKETTKSLDVDPDEKNDDNTLGCIFPTATDKESNKTVRNGPLRVFKNKLHQRLK